jgi:uncharacterized protein (TIGR03066 family)
MAAEDSPVYHYSASTPEDVEVSAAAVRARQDMTFSILCERNLLMRHLGFIATGFLVLCLAACSGKKDDKKDKDGAKDDGKKPATNEEKLVGTWEMTKAKQLQPGTKVTIEFTKDGKMLITAKVKSKDKEETFPSEGTYKVEGDTVKSTAKGPDGKENKETMKIKTITDTKLIVEDEKGEIEEFTKK